MCLWMKPVTLLALGLLALSLAGCDSGGPPPPEPRCVGPLVPSSDEPLVPLTVGNTWTYQSTYYQIPTPRTDTFRAQVTAETRVCYEGKVYQAAVWSWLDPATERPTFPQWLRWNGPRGYYTLGGIFEADTFKTRFLERKYPAEAGMEYDVPRFVYHKARQQFRFIDTLTHRVDSTRAEFTTPAGTFASYVFHHKRRPAPDVGGFWHYKSYYAPSVGPVGLIVKEDDGDLVSRRILLEYQISKTEK